ncbi:AAA family ATPase [Yimella sp. cx-573]|nr:AAA family ATPase [Yimella sp. cx-573]
MSWDATRLHIVTGKGGTGKTTVASALALALAEQGKQVLLAEVEGRQGISQAFDVPPLGEVETRVARTANDGAVWGLSVDAKAALLEYLQMYYKLGMARGMLERFGVIDFATTIAPGVRDVLLIGKVYEAVRRRASRRGVHHDQIYDVIVLDAPPTGRIGRFLNVNQEVAGLAKVGPIKNQAESIMTMLTGAETAVHLVTLLEEMPVQETLEAAAELSEIGLRIGDVVVNQERADVLHRNALAILQDENADLSALESDLAAGGLRVGPTLVGGLVQAGRDLGDRLALQEQELRDLQALDRPMRHLPFVPGGVDGGALRHLASYFKGDRA